MDGIEGEFRSPVPAHEIDEESKLNGEMVEEWKQEEDSGERIGEGVEMVVISGFF